MRQAFLKRDMSRIGIMLTASIGVLLISCDVKVTDKKTELKNRKFLYRYESGLEVIGDFKSNDYLEWECIKGPAKGQTGQESIHIFEISRNIYFVSWLEKSGTSVSQIVDLNKFMVRVFVTYDSGQGRQSFVDTGTLEEIKK